MFKNKKRFKYITKALGVQATINRTELEMIRELNSQVDMIEDAVHDLFLSVEKLERDVAALKKDKKKSNANGKASR